MIVQSHRGAGDLAPDNTFESFLLGWQLGTIPEADVRATRDGVLVAFHDNDFSRCVKDAPEELKPLSVKDLAWDELSKLEVGAWMDEKFRGQRIPRISDVFEAMRDVPERWLYIDVKDLPFEVLSEMGDEYGVTNRLILASTHYAHIRRWKELAPGSGTLLWMGGTEERLRERMAEVRAAGFESITQLQIHVNVVDLSADDSFSPSSAFLREVGEEIKPLGILFQSLPWHCAETEVYHKLMDLGVESFASDQPAITVEAMKSWGANS